MANSEFKITVISLTISLCVLITANSFAFMFLGQDHTIPSIWRGDSLDAIQVNALIEQARLEAIPEQFRDTLAARLDINSQYCWKNNPDDPNQGISYVYDYDHRFDPLPVLRIDYDVSSARVGTFNGYSIKLNPQDLSRDYSDKISFYIRGDAEKGFTRRLKVEFKNERGKIGTYIIDGIDSEWRKIEIDKSRVGDFAFQSYWRDIKEIVLVFEDHRVTRKEGRIYLAGFTYPESWQVARAAESLYAKLGQIDSGDRERILAEISGPEVEYSFNPEDIGSVNNWILSSQGQISRDSGVYALREMLKSYDGKVPFLSDLRIASVAASLLGDAQGLDGGYNPSLYSLYRAAQISGYSPYAVRLSNFSELEDFFNKTESMPLVAELKTGEYVLLNGVTRGGFLWLTKFAKFDEFGKQVTMSEADFTQLWSGHILSLRLASPYRALTNQEVHQWENTGLIVEDMVRRAKELAATGYQPVRITAIPALDPPLYGRPEAEGLVYQEYLAIGGDKFYDDGLWWFQARPRGSQNKYPLKLFLYNQDTRQYEAVEYDFSRYNYSAATPPITSVPPEGRYLTGLDLGRILVAGRFPQFFTIGGDGYMRFVPLAEGKEMGASFRVAGQNVTHSREGGDPYDESFPIVRELYIKKISDNWINLVALVDAEGFTGVLDIKINPGEETRMTVNARFFMRRDILLSQEPDTGFAAFSSMFFLGDEKNDEMIGEMRHTPWNPHDEAHDSDYLVVHYADGGMVEQLINRPFQIRVDRYDFGRPDTGIVSFSLQQRDRNPDHYRAFAASDYANRPSFDFRILDANIPLTVKLYEIYTDNEYVDNIVVLLAMGRDLHRGEEIKLRYEVVAYDYQE